MAKDKYTADEMIAALQETKGMITLAARKLGCSITTVQRYVDTYPTVQAAKQAEHDKLGDSVELTLYDEAIQKRNITALIFLAKTQFKDRGYVERQEVTGKDGKPIEVKAYGNFNPDEWDTPEAPD